MRRPLLAVLCWLLLCAAAPVPLRLAPAEPLLGVPLLLTVTLPDADTELAGLPPLDPFELLEPPQRAGRELRLLLLPMRPGRQRLPALPLHQGPSRQLSTEALMVTVGDGLAPEAEPASLKRLERRRQWSPAWPAALVAAVLAAGFGLRWRRRLPDQPAPPLESLVGERLLAELRQRLELLPDQPRRLLAERLARLRFAPRPPSEQEIAELLSDYLAAAEGER